MNYRDYIIKVKPIKYCEARINEPHLSDNRHKAELTYDLSIQRCHGDNPPFEGAVQLDLVYYMPIPKLTRLRSPSQFHYTNPSLAELTQHLELALFKAQVLKNKDQISIFTQQKLYDKNPRVIFRITELHEK